MAYKKHVNASAGTQTQKSNGINFPTNKTVRDQDQDRVGDGDGIVDRD